MKCKEIASDFIFDAMPWSEDAVVLRQSSPSPMDLYIISYDVFAEKFSPIGD